MGPKHRCLHERDSHPRMRDGCRCLRRGHRIATMPDCANDFDSAARATLNRSPIAGKPCSATAENFTQLRLKRRCFATIEELFYGNPQAIFAATLSPQEWLAVAFYSKSSSQIAATANPGVRLALIVMPFGFTSRSAHHMSTASIARCGTDLRVARDKTGRSSPTPQPGDDKPDEQRAQDRRGPTQAFCSE